MPFIADIADGAGQILNINAYDEYGIPMPTNLGRFAYTGQIWLDELQMYHYKARIYSPTLGRFLQTDPVGYDDQINLYAYVGNDPVNAMDPSGETTMPSVKALIPALQGLGRALFGPRKPARTPRGPPVVVRGGTFVQRVRMQASVDRVLSTPRGRQMAETAARTQRQEAITIPTVPMGGTIPETGRALIHPDYHPLYMSEHGPLPATTEQVVGHEFGHSIMGDEDDGPGNMNNINKNENPVADSLKLPKRVEHENPQ